MKRDAGSEPFVWKSLFAACAIIVLMMASSKTVVAENGSQFKVSVGLDYTTGDYGTGQDTDILYVPFTGEFETGPWVFSLTIPYIRIEGTGAVVGGGTPVVVGGGSGQRSTQSGLGDILVSTKYGFVPKTDWLIDFTGEIKLPTASESAGLGTGEIDFTVQVDVAKRIGRLTPFGGIGYRFVGNDGQGLKDQALLSAGVTYALEKTLNAGVALDYSSASSDGSDDGLELSPSFSWDVTDRLDVNLYGVIGLTDSSPDYGGGFQLSFKL